MWSQSCKSSSIKPSVETGLNPENYPDNEVPVSVMANDFLTTYKYGWKTSYYQNTHDLKSDEVEETKTTNQELDSILNEILSTEEETCESCAV